MLNKTTNLNIWIQHVGKYTDKNLDLENKKLH